MLMICDGIWWREVVVGFDDERRLWVLVLDWGGGKLRREFGFFQLFLIF
jgi:hypothetical protein